MCMGCQWVQLYLKSNASRVHSLHIHLGSACSIAAVLFSPAGQTSRTQDLNTCQAMACGRHSRQRVCKDVALVVASTWPPGKAVQSRLRKRTRRQVQRRYHRARCSDRRFWPALNSQRKCAQSASASIHSATPPLHPFMNQRGRPDDVDARSSHTICIRMHAAQRHYDQFSTCNALRSSTIILLESCIMQYDPDVAIQSSCPAGDRHRQVPRQRRRSQCHRRQQKRPWTWTCCHS